MKNLAGVADCDAQVVGELALAGVPHERISGEPKGEVPTQYRGVLTIGSIGVLTIERAWCYWVVRGSIPLAVAQRLYVDPVGRRDVRVDGHAAAPQPVYPWVAYYQDGKRLYRKEDERELVEIEVRGDAAPKILRDALAEARRTCRYVDDPTVGEGFVHTYHVDSQDGLNLLVEVLRQDTPKAAKG